MKLINGFLKMNIWVFGYTAPKEERNIQKNTRKTRPNMKNIIYLIAKLFLAWSEKECANVKEVCCLTREIFLSNKNIN